MAKNIEKSAKSGKKRIKKRAKSGKNIDYTFIL